MNCRVVTYAAKKKAFKEKYKRDPSPAEEKAIRDSGVTEAVTPKVHKETDTSGGKNTDAKSTKDASDLEAAQKRGEEDLNAAKERAGK